MVGTSELDNYLFKAFMAAAETENFTEAAKAAGMTQSGVSQHIAKLEKQVGAVLFERVNKEVLLTSAGKELRAFIEGYGDSVNGLLERLAGQKLQMKGWVKYAMPESCLKTPHFPILLKDRQKYFEGVDLAVRIAPNEEILNLLLNDQIDFGFVTRRSANPAIEHELFAEEEYVLVGVSRKEIENLDAGNLMDLSFIEYPGMDVLLEFWRKAHFPKKRSFNIFSMRKRGSINHLEGAITMVRHGLGCGVFPRHTVAEHLNSGELHQFSQKGKSNPVGEIFIVSRGGSRRSARVQRVLDSFWAMK